MNKETSMRRLRLPAALCLLVLAAASPSAFAQRTTGTIVGSVTDDSGALMPGVTVSLRSDQVVGTQTSITGADGRFRFVALPPGSYDLAFALQGFATLNRRGVRVSVGSTVEENAQLKVTQLSEEVTVVGESPVVDTQTNSVSTNYDKDWVRNAPVRRFSFFDLINAAPGVNQASNGAFANASSSSFGSGTDENSYQLDGTDFTAPTTGEAWPYPNTDAIEEIEVLSLGAPAEYGGLQGAVFNVVTRQGSNEFYGDANFYYQSQGLTGRNTSDAEDGGFPYHRNKYNDFTAQLGGPIVKDKLWFFASYQYQRDDRAQPGVDPDFPVKEAADRVFGKINWQINAKNKLQIAYHDDYYELPFPATAFTSPSSIQVETGHNPSPGVTFTSILSDKTYIEARYSGFYGKDHADPLNECAQPSRDCGPRDNPRFLDFDTGETTGGIYYWYDGEVWKSAATLKLSHFADDFLGGSHDFKFGVQYNSGGSEYTLGYNDYIYTFSESYPGYGYGYSRLPYNYGGLMKNVGVFADDTFRVNSRLTLNLGVRYDNSKGYFPEYDILDKQGNPTGQTTNAVDKLFDWNTISPRVGFNYKLTNDGRTVLRGHYGRYYRGIVTGEFAALTPSVPQLMLGVWDFENNQFFPDSLEVVSDNTNLRIDPNFDAPYTDQFTASLEREMFANFGVSLHYTHKRGNRYGGYRDIGGRYTPVTYLDDQGADATNQPITVFRLDNDTSERLFQLTNPDDMFTRYNGVILQVNKRMADNWQMVSSLTLGKSEGRIGSSSARQTPISGQFGTASVFGRNPNDSVNTDGLLVGDRSWQFKTQVVYEAPWKLLFGANLTLQSGLPWGRTIRVTDTTGFTTTIRADALDGDKRVSSWKLLDLRAQKEFALGSRANLAVFADLLNTLNDDAYENVENSLGTADNYGRPSRFVFPRRLMLGAKFRF
jgi:outer membrane receptor protein involved in Fe transport